MARIEARRLETGSVIPHFRLPAMDGGEVSTREFKQRNNLLIVFLDPDRCSGSGLFLKQLAGRQAELRELETRVLVVLPLSLDRLEGTPPVANLPFPVLSDEGGEVGRAYLGDQGAGAPVAGVFVTDKYSALREGWLCRDGESLPDPSPALDSLRLIECECPE